MEYRHEKFSERFECFIADVLSASFFFPFLFPPYVKGGNCNLWVKGSNVILYLSKFMTGYIVHSTNNVYIMINIGFFLVYGVFPHCV